MRIIGYEKVEKLLPGSSLPGVFGTLYQRNSCKNRGKAFWFFCLLTLPLSQ